MKKLLLILACILLVGCSKTADYKEISDSVILTLQGKEYSDKLDTNQKQLLENYLLEKDTIKVNDYIIYEDDFRTNEKNTYGVEVIDDVCYIKLSNIVFNNSLDHGDSESRIVCNGYYTFLSKDSVTNTTTYDTDFRFLGYYKDNLYHFVYRSYLNGNIVVVNIGDKIDVSFENIDLNNIKLHTVANSTIPSKIVPIVIIGFISVIIFLLWKRFQENNDL